MTTKPEQTLLEMTQDILSAMTSDEINSITDTVESQQVATIIKNKYYDILTREGLPEHNQVFQLTASGSASTPTLMYVPAGVKKIEWIKYFNDTTTDDDATVPTGYQYVPVISNSQFFDMIGQLNPGDDNVSSWTFSDTSNNYPGDFTFYYRDDKQPDYCTILSNYYVIFDSYDSDFDSTLQEDKTMCQGQVIPTFTMTDSFIPNMDPSKFPLLLNEAKALAFFELKQMPHPKAEQEIRRQWISTQKNKRVENQPSDFQKLNNFGRK